ncbi:hypothetical protein GJAV_G00015940 [Gymnothorax javanicus]|nr:hypothetical protein GJAV_G00015940 [Gymnothorax javanicus]
MCTSTRRHSSSSTLAAGDTKTEQQGNRPNRNTAHTTKPKEDQADSLQRWRSGKIWGPPLLPGSYLITCRWQ